MYSPWVEQIERLWHALHETITWNHQCRTLGELSRRVFYFLDHAAPFPGNGHGLGVTGAEIRISYLELAKELNNVSKACKLIGCSRQQFCMRFAKNYQTYGAEGLLDKLPELQRGASQPGRSRLSRPSSITLTRPTHGPLRWSQELALQGINVSAGGGVWQRHDLLSKHDRLLRLEKTHREQTIEPSFRTWIFLFSVLDGDGSF